MRKYKLLNIILLVCVSVSLNAQMHIFVNSHQPDPLTANAGANITVTSGSTVQLGANPTVTGGSPEYTYLWLPSENISDATIANPTVTVTQSTQYVLTVTDAHNCTTFDTINIAIGTIGVNELINTTAFNIYPNPNNGNFKINLNTSTEDFVELIVYNNIGQAIYHKIFYSNINNFQKEINLLNCIKGLYIAKININNKTYIKKFNIQ